jgi:O-antigen ligase
LPSSQSDRSALIRLVELPAYAAVLIFISAIWYESDAYRYVALATLVPTTAYYFYRDFLSDEKVLIGYVGLLCLGWSLYVGARFAYIYLFHEDLGIGSSEGIYLFPLLYPISGYALFLCIRRPLVVVCAFVLISFLVALYSLDFSALVEGERAKLILQHNPIHAAAAQGMIALCMLPFASYLMRTDDMSRALRIGFAVLSLATLLLCLVNIYTLQSKGVWLALAVAFPFQLLLIGSLRAQRRRIVITASALAAVAAVAVIAWDGIFAVAGETAEATGRLLSDAFGGAGLFQGMDHAIRNEDLPGSFRERLMLWASALLIWMQNPIFGRGVVWLHEWGARAYPAADYNLMHNSYLEIAIRYGIAGLVFYAVLFAWVIGQVWRASRKGVIDPAAFDAYVAVFLFFCITMGSNSNFRLAIGESYLWFAAAIGFYCYYRLQERNLVKVTTWM